MPHFSHSEYVYLCINVVGLQEAEYLLFMLNLDSRFYTISERIELDDLLRSNMLNQNISI